MRTIRCLLIVLAMLLASVPAWALNKQGLSVGVGDADEHEAPAQNLTGYVFGGALVYNPNYAARPDNTGLALARTGAHADLDVWRKLLSISYDANVFTDRSSGGQARPSEYDHIVGVLTRHGDLELGAHYEADRPADRPGLAQSYTDVHARLYWRALPQTGLSGFFTLGGFLYNPSYAARPDLSGSAMLRFVAHSDFDVLRPWLTLSVDLNVFTDRQTRAGVVPSELDTTLGLALHLGQFDVSLVGENDRPVDRPGLQQSYLSILLGCRFDARRILGRASNVEGAQR